ncbi:MAG: glutamine--fructose-6-phosphate transaminase (isomerizing), partial [Gammaproteobacteria bacterium]
VKLLEEKMIQEKPRSKLGIAHTRWATHGEPSEINAHPHKSAERIYIVHNGIIENHVELKKELEGKGYIFASQTDSELIAHLIDFYLNTSDSVLDAVFEAKARLEGAYAIAVLDHQNPESIIIARQKSPLLIGLGTDENLAASDPLAISQLTNEFIFLEDGDVAQFSSDSYEIYDSEKLVVEREITRLDISSQATSKGDFRHFMEKEIYEQPQAVLNTIDGRVGAEDVLDNIFGLNSNEIFSKVERIQIAACGTSLHAGRVAASWLSAIAELPCQIDYASEYRYRNPHVDENSLFITISQSGETADTLAALSYAKEKDYLATVGICNVPTSTLARESDFVLFTNAGPEIGVASTKAFTTQLAALLLLTLSLAKARDLNPKLRARVIEGLRSLPEVIRETLELKDKIVEMAPEVASKDNALFLGRGIFYPVAKEGALKLKEISYIHAEAYPAGELKHGPLALIDEDMPVIALAPESEIAEKLISNLEEVKARGGKLYVFADPSVNMDVKSGRLVHLPKCDFLLTPIVYTIPLQILSYEVALLRGTDIDQPRNLAKSVTVE